MILGIDIDEVLRDFVGQLMRVYKQDFPDSECTYPDAWDMKKNFPAVADLYEYFGKTRAREIFSEAPMYPQSVESLERLRRHHKIVLCTAQLPMAEQYTTQWVRKHDIPFDGLLFTSDKTLLKADVLLDDGLHNLEAVSRVGITAVAMSKPWNKDWRGNRVDSIEEFAEIYA